MAHEHPPSQGFGAAGPPAHRAGETSAVGHADVDHEYDVTPPGSGHEHTDANVWIIVKFGLWLAIAALIVHVGLGLLFGLFVQQREEAEHVFPLAVGQGERLPVEPRLQRFPENEITGVRRQEENVLQNYGWIDREGGRVQIPISEAMRLMVERGLPARTQRPDAAPPAATQATATTQAIQAAPAATDAPALETPAFDMPPLVPADSSSGRTMERRRQ
jgi:hypothetical protein